MSSQPICCKSRLAEFLHFISRLERTLFNVLFPKELGRFVSAVAPAPLGHSPLAPPPALPRPDRPSLDRASRGALFTRLLHVTSPVGRWSCGPFFGPFSLSLRCLRLCHFCCAMRQLLSILLLLETQQLLLCHHLMTSLGR